MNLLCNILSYFLSCFLSIFMCFNNMYVLTYQNQNNFSIDILSFQTLISFPDKVIDRQQFEDKITPSEFIKILTHLYNNNYILVKLSDIINFDSNSIKPTLQIPSGKTPIILTFDNVSYTSNLSNSGSIDKIIVDRKNNLATYSSKKSIQDRISYDNEFIPILEDFIFNHPDFSHNSARGIIFCTGKDGLLGYNTNHKNASAPHNIKRVCEVVSLLKTKGWEFGCNGYTYNPQHTLSNIELIKDLDLWNKEIKPIVGNTNLFALPHADTSTLDTELSNLLTKNNFNIQFLNAPLTPAITKSDNRIICSRKIVSGHTLRTQPEMFSHLFNSEDVYDEIARNTPFNQLPI